MSESRIKTVLQYVAANTRRLRGARGWTQADLAKATGFDRRSIQLLEAGDGNPTVKLLVAVADALVVAPTDLFAPAKLEPPVTGRPPSPK